MTHTVTHSVMFHHFHSEDHLTAQGSLSEKNFRDMLLWLQNNYSLMGATDYWKKFTSSTLSSSDICLSFDDALRCQYDIAVPLLAEFGLDAFFFIYSSAFTDNPDFLEIYRLFRTSHFDCIEDFYSNFFSIVEQLDKVDYKKHRSFYKSINYLSAFPFYSENDKWFRYLRDKYLGSTRYNEIMTKMMTVNGFDLENAKKNIWMLEDHVKILEQNGHLIGLHSYSHPTQMSQLSREDQQREYSKNYDHLSKILANPIKAMSHPCGNYNNDTLKILENMGIQIGFRSNMSVLEIKSSLEIPREDHSNVFKEMNL